jgi:hypothetical protein
MYCSAYPIWCGRREPGSDLFARQTGVGKGWYGWPCDPKLNALRDAWATYRRGSFQVVGAGPWFREQARTTGVNYVAFDLDQCMALFDGAF